MRKISLIVFTILLLFTSTCNVQAREIWYPYGSSDCNSYVMLIKNAYESGDEEAVYRYLNLTVTLLLKDAYSTNYLEYMFDHGENLWLKEIAVANGKYPYNEVSEDTSHFSMYTTAEKSYQANETAGNQYPSNQIMNGLYYVDGTVSANDTDAGREVDIDCFLYPNPELIIEEKVLYVVNAEEIEIWEYPTMLSNVIGYYHYSDEINIIGMTKDENWYLVKYGDENAYIKNSYLGDTLEPFLVKITVNEMIYLDVTDDGVVYYRVVPRNVAKK